MAYSPTTATACFPLFLCALTVSAHGHVDNSLQARSCPHIHRLYDYFNPALVKIIKSKKGDDNPGNIIF